MYPRMDYLNASLISEVGEVVAMPRHMVMVSCNSKTVTGWFMDFKL